MCIRDSIYTTNKKDVQKQNLFAAMASEDSLNGFMAEYDISHQLDINEYKVELMKALARNYPNTDSGGNEEHWQLILLGLAISYIQRRYELVDSNFEHLRVDKKEFDQYMSDSVRTKIEKTLSLIHI